MLVRPVIGSSSGLDDIKMILLDGEMRQTLLEEQFARDNASWTELASTRWFVDLLVPFATREQTPITSREDFANAFQANHRKMPQQFGERAADKIYEISTPMPVFLWIADDKEAVFSIPTYRTGVAEFGFHTIDAELVAALARIWRRYEGAARQIDLNAP